jgi:hypothetical protein
LVKPRSVRFEFLSGFLKVGEGGLEIIGGGQLCGGETEESVTGEVLGLLDVGEYEVRVIGCTKGNGVGLGKTEGYEAPDFSHCTVIKVAFVAVFLHPGSGVVVGMI